MSEVELVDGASAVALDPGDVLVVRLPENPTTGYVWHARAGEGLRLLDEPTPQPPDPDRVMRAPGAGHARTFRLVAERTGSWRVDLRLARPWEDASEQQRRVDVTVR